MVQKYEAKNMSISWARFTIQAEQPPGYKTPLYQGNLKPSSVCQAMVGGISATCVNTHEWERDRIWWRKSSFYPVTFASNNKS